VSFSLESQLCEVLARHVLEVLGVEHAAAVLEEVRVGTVVPDLVVVSRGGSALDLRLSGFESWIVADLIRTRSRRIDTLSRRLFARTEITVRAVERLERAGLVERLSADAVSLRHACFPVESEVIAVEAKLRRWREAVEQAVGYQRFANRSYVALPADIIDGGEEILEACRSRGLGVLSVSRQGARVALKAPLRRLFSPGWVWVVGQARVTERSKQRSRLPALHATPVGVPVRCAG
jgi:hypothetical protein